MRNGRNLRYMSIAGCLASDSEVTAFLVTDTYWSRNLEFFSPFSFPQVSPFLWEVVKKKITENYCRAFNLLFNVICFYFPNLIYYCSYIISYYPWNVTLIIWLSYYQERRFLVLSYQVGILILLHLQLHHCETLQANRSEVRINKLLKSPFAERKTS